MITLFNQDLKNFNTFLISANVKKVIFVTSENDFKFLDLKKIMEKKSIILGHGSNILFVNIPEEIILLRTKGIKKIWENSRELFLSVKAGEIWDDFVEFCVNNSFYGIENMSGIPGTVGAAAINNIGAFGEEICKYIDKVYAFNIIENKLFQFTNKDCNYNYRNSFFKNNKQFIVTEVIFKLYKTPENINITYGNISNYFKNKPITLYNIRQVIIHERTLRFPNYKHIGNAGSFFKNPIVQEDTLKKIISEYPDVPFFPVENYSYKIPAAWLIEKCGLKNIRYKNTGTYNHPLIIVNYNNANGKEILEFSEFIRLKVQEKFNILLEEEVVIF